MYGQNIRFQTPVSQTRNNQGFLNNPYPPQNIIPPLPISSGNCRLTSSTNNPLSVLGNTNNLIPCTEKPNNSVPVSSSNLVPMHAILQVPFHVPPPIVANTVPITRSVNNSVPVIPQMVNNSVPLTPYLVNSAVPITPHMVKNVPATQHMINSGVSTVPITQHTINKPIHVPQDTINRPMPVPQDTINRPMPVTQDTINRAIPVTRDVINRPISVTQDKISRPMPVTQHMINRTMPVIQHTINRALPVTQHTINSTMPVAQHTINSTMPVAQHVINRAMSINQHMINRTIPATQHMINRAVPVTQQSINSAIPVVPHMIKNAISVTQQVINNAEPVTSQLSNIAVPITPPVIKGSVPFGENVLHPVESRNELKLLEFLKKFLMTKKKEKFNVSIPDFRSALKTGFLISKELQQRKHKLNGLLQSNEETWTSEMKQISELKDQLSEICNFVISVMNSNSISKKLKVIKKKREQKKKTKLNVLSTKMKAQQAREKLNQEIDKWLYDIKEKNLKLKREAEMKKEADYILLEVRRKIHEAKRTIEKIKVLEKLRNVRHASAAQKGLHILPEHNKTFDKKVSILKELMSKQLVDYEAEEKALKVMLETEQEGQLEEEAQWKLKKLKTLQQKKQKQICKCLFGSIEDPSPSDPLYFFYKYHTAANDSIENLAQIRHQWDVYLANDGESIPQQWIVPVTDCDASWKQCLL